MSTYCIKNYRMQLQNNNFWGVFRKVFCLHLISVQPERQFKKSLLMNFLFLLIGEKINFGMLIS